MNKSELIQKVISKKEFSQLPEIDVELAYKKFERRQCSDEEKIKLMRDFLRRAFSAFASDKILSPKNKSSEWILRKHLSTRERLPFYEEVYSRILKGLPKKISVFDFGAGINGFSYEFFKQVGFNVKYFGFESVGQLVNLTNSYFEKNSIDGKVFHLSLFDIKKIKEILAKEKTPKVMFLFKVIDALEMIEDNYTKNFLSEVSKYFERMVISFPTRSMHKREKFGVSRNWIVNLIKNNFILLDDFEIGGERYLVFERSKNL
jgi:hypothetical protein